MFDVKPYPDIKALAHQIEEEITKRGLSNFHHYSTKLLKEFLEYNKLCINDIFKWICFCKTPTQHKLFGTVPVTLYSSNNFVIDIYNWDESDTDIHDHAFSGSFAVLNGELLHVEYEYLSQEYFHDILFGNLKTKHHKIIKPYNEVITIHPNNKFIHKTLHLSKTTTTICVRTINNNYDQLGYYKSGIACRMKNKGTNYLAISLYTFTDMNLEEIRNVAYTIYNQKKISLFLDFILCVVSTRDYALNDLIDTKIIDNNLLSCLKHEYYLINKYKKLTEKGLELREIKIELEKGTKHYELC